MVFLEIDGIHKSQNGEAVLTDIHFKQDQFQKIAIAGTSGAGKTTLLKIIAGLIQPDNGKVIFKTERVLGPDEQLIPGHKRIAYISQHFELRNNYRVEEELDYTNQLSIEKANDIFNVCKVSHLLKRWTDELSGGEKQRIVIARSLIASPTLLLLDEPFSNLDMAHTHIMKHLIDDITQSLKISCILVSHDPLDILSWADQIIVLEKGRIIQQDEPAKVYLQPVNEYAAALFGNYNLLIPENAKKKSAQLMIRPEHFVIVPEKTKSTVEGFIQQVVYFGSYIELRVQINEQVYIVKTMAGDFTVGQTVNVLIQKERGWMIDN